MVMQKMRAGAQGLAAKVLMGLIVFVLAVTGFGAIQLFSASEPVAATINGDEVTERALETEVRRVRQEYRRLAENITDETLDSIVRRDAVLETLVDKTLLRQTAAELGLAISDEAVQQRINQQIAAEGIDEGVFRSFLASTGHTPASYHAARRGDELIGQLQRAVRDTAFVTARERQRSSRVVAQRRDIAWLTFNAMSLMPDIAVSDEEIEEHYRLYQGQYVTEERFDFDFVRLSRSTLAADVEVVEDDVMAAYEAEVAAAEPLRHAAHILLEVTEERGADEAMRQLAEVRQTIDSDASFAAKAREISEDPGTAADGGDLGPSARGVFPTRFEEALWALAPGEMSAPVETEFGIHLIRLLGVEAPEVPPLAERRDDIAAQLRGEEAERRFESVLGEMDQLAFESEDSLDELTRTYDLTIEQLDGVTRDAQEGLLADAAVHKAFFSDEVLVDGFNTRAVATANFEAVVARLRARHPATQRPLEDVRESIRLTLAHDGARRLAEDQALKALEALAEGATPAQIGSEQGLSWERADGMARGDADVPGPVADAAFNMRAPPPGEREADVALLEDGSRALVLLSDVALADYGAMSETELADLTQVFESASAQRDFAAVLATARGEASIETIDLATDGAP